MKKKFNDNELQQSTDDNLLLNEIEKEIITRLIKNGNDVTRLALSYGFKVTSMPLTTLNKEEVVIAYTLVGEDTKQIYIDYNFSNSDEKTSKNYIRTLVMYELIKYLATGQQEEHYIHQRTLSTNLNYSVNEIARKLIREYK